jgi:hypothetical protein
MNTAKACEFREKSIAQDLQLIAKSLMNITFLHFFIAA